MRTMADCQFLPAGLPSVEIMAGYMPSPNTAHHWSADDWSRVKNAGYGILPIFVAVPGADAIAGAQYGRDAVQFARGLNMPDGSSIVLDVEHADATQAKEGGQAQAWVGVVGAEGFHPVIYESVTDESLFAGMADLWGAHWGQPAEIPPGYVALQYDGGQGKPFDFSVVADTVPIAFLEQKGTPLPNPAASPTVGFAATHTGDGYWQVTEDGHIYAFGDAHYAGGPDDPHMAHVPIKGIVGHPSDMGYWVIGVDGSVYGYGAAKYHGSYSNGHLHPGQ